MAKKSARVPASKLSRWVTVSWAADVLGISEQHVTMLAYNGKIRRQLTRITNIHTKPRYLYSIDDIATLRRERGYAGRIPRYDVTQKWLSASSAAGLLGCSVNSIYKYGDEGKIRMRQYVQFQYPVARLARGYFAADVFAIATLQRRYPAVSDCEELTFYPHSATTRKASVYGKVKDRKHQQAIKKYISELQGIV